MPLSLLLKCLFIIGIIYYILADRSKERRNNTDVRMEAWEKELVCILCIYVHNIYGAGLTCLRLSFIEG